MKLIILFLGIFLLSIGLHAGELTGLVTDSTTSKGIPFAFVQIIDLNIGAVADEHGHFELEESFPYPIQIRFSSIGYESKIVVIDSAMKKEAILIQLIPAHNELDEIKINVSSGVYQRYFMSNVEEKSMDELNTIASTNITEAISNIGSVYSQSTGNGIGKPVIRGLSGSRVVTSLNGLRIENQQWGGDHGFGLTSLGIDQVLIIKGPSAIIYGADALGGIVHLNDEKYLSPGSFQTEFSSKFESNSLRTANEASVKFGRTNFRINAYAAYSNSADYQMGNGQYADNSRWQGGAFKTSIGLNKKNWVANIRYNFNRNFIGLPGHTHDSIVDNTKFRVNTQNRAWKLPMQQITSHFGLMENILFLKNGDLRLLTGFTSNRLTELEDKVTVPGIDNALDNYTYNLRYRHKYKKSHQFIAGTQGAYQTNTNLPKAEESLIPNANQFDKGAYLLWNWGSKTIETQLGTRYDYRNIKSQNNSYNFTGLNFSAGAVKSWKPFIIRLNSSTGYRPPNINELTSNGIHHGSIRYELGNSNLKAEYANQVDMSIELESEHLGLVLNPFVNQVRNFVYLEAADSTVNGYSVYKYQQSKSVMLTGGDIGIHYHPHFMHQLHFESTYSMLYTEDHLGKPLPFIPQSRINSTVQLKINNKGLLQLENISIQHLYFFDQNKVGALETTSPHYQLLHIGAKLKINTKHPLNLSLGCKNVLNTSYIDHLSRLKNIDLQNPGRNFYLGIKWQINKTKNLHDHEN